jgi:hypothetical protein
VDDGDDVCEVALECGVKVGTALEGGEAVAVGEFGEDANVAAVFELKTCRKGIG